MVINVLFIIFWDISLQTFLLYELDFAKNSLFFKIAIFLQILKVEHLSYLDIKHRIPSISWFSSTTAGIGLKEGREWNRRYEVV